MRIQFSSARQLHPIYMGASSISTKIGTIPDSALERKKRAHPPTERKLDGAKEARLIALACSEPPKGHKRWTLKLLADELVALENIDSISYRTVQRTLKKTNLDLT